MESFGTRFMGSQGPCLHCGINESSLWITGPPGKPVLCNACGSRWQTRGTLDDYIPNHANRERQDGSSASLEVEMNNITSSGSVGSSSHNYIQMEETNGEAGKDPLWNPDSVPKWTRSELRQHILSPVERLQRQLLANLQGPNFEDIAVDDDTVTLIYAQNKYIPPNEIGLGAMLFVSPTTTTERSTSLSPMAVDNASCSMNVPVENSYLINNNLQDHVALQNQATGNEGGNTSARENALSLPPMDITSRVSGQTSQGARGGARRGRPVRRPRGRPPRSTTRGR